MADRSIVGVDKGCITALQLAIKPKEQVTVAIDESLLAEPTLVMCAGCCDPLDHSQHNVCSIPPKALLGLLEDTGTPVVSLQSGAPIGSAEVVRDSIVTQHSTLVQASEAEAPAKAEGNTGEWGLTSICLVVTPGLAEEQEEKSFQSKQLADVTALVEKIEKMDKTVTTCDFAHKAIYIDICIFTYIFNNNNMK